MARPSTRRLGFSRRAHLSLFIGYVVAVAGILFALLLLAISFLDPTGFNALRGAALDLTSPITRSGAAISRAVIGAGESVGNYVQAGSQNASLKQRLEAAERDVIAAKTLRLENMRLKRTLGLVREVERPVATGRVIGSSFDSSRSYATITVGSSGGVRIGQPVRAADGLLGRVIETGLFTARIMLVTDGANTVPVQLARTGTAALATGRGDGTIDLKTLEVGQSPFRRGDIVITSGVGGVYPPGVPVARVVSVQRDMTIARPLADPATVGFAVVQEVYLPAPAPAPSLVPRPNEEVVEGKSAS